MAKKTEADKSALFSEILEGKGPFRDNGTGPYTYCERGDSRCLDQTCPCLDNLPYKFGYLRTRGELTAGSLAGIVVRSPVVWMVAVAALALYLLS
jgi:hypothetical protein